MDKEKIEIIKKLFPNHYVHIKEKQKQNLSIYIQKTLTLITFPKTLLN